MAGYSRKTSRTGKVASRNRAGRYQNKSKHNQSISSKETHRSAPKEDVLETKSKAKTQSVHSQGAIPAVVLPILSHQGYQRKRGGNTIQKQVKAAFEPAAKYRSKNRATATNKLSRAGRPKSSWSNVRFVMATSAAILLSISIIGISWGTYEVVFKDLPTVTDLTQRPLAISSKLYDRNGQLMYTMYDDENRTLVPLSHISTPLIQATVAIEDRDFYEHNGFSLKGIFRAFLENFQGKPIQGGSTITQQLVKNRLLSSEKTYKRKLRELLLALLVERSYTKNQILEMYLNTVAFGGSTYGVEEAAQRYFGKSASQLSLAESALLAGLPAAPSAYSPFGPNPEYSKTRQLEVLRRMQEDGYISEEQAQSAMQEPLALITDKSQIRAPHFVMYVRQLLAEKYGEEALYTQGFKVKTTLDLSLQEEAQQIVSDEVDSLKRMRITNGAALVTNPSTGEILAMIGSINYFDLAHDGQVNVTLRPRQPGSSIKPLEYAMALEQGQTMNTLIMDNPISYSFPGSPPYTPKNYDGSFHGAVTIKEALANSYNIPAVKTLASVGINNFIDRAEKMGISTWGDRSRFGLSLALGSGEVRMLDLATAYGVFAAKGYKVEPNPIMEITNAKGEVVYRNQCAFDPKSCQRSYVMDEKVAFIISNILSDNKARTPAFGPLSTLYIPNQEVAVKTGTTNSMRDNWTIGYTSDRLVAVWVGNNDNTPMSYVASGITGASPIWNKIFRTQLSAEYPHTFEVPAGMVKVAACRGTSSGDYYIAGTEPKNGCPVPQPKKVANPNASPSTATGQGQPTDSKPSAARQNRPL